MPDLTKVHIFQEEEPDSICAISSHKCARVQHVAQRLTHLQAVLQSPDPQGAAAVRKTFLELQACTDRDVTTSAQCLQGVP